MSIEYRNEEYFHGVLRNLTELEQANLMTVLNELNILKLPDEMKAEILDDLDTIKTSVKDAYNHIKKL